MLKVTPNNSRRSFIKQCAAVSTGFVGLSQFIATRTFANSFPLQEEVKKWLQLPKGFSYKIISEWGQKMSDGFLVPGRADGMATFTSGKKVVLIRNHENGFSPTKHGPFADDMTLLPKIDRSKLFDYGFGQTPGLGGTTTMIFNEDKQVVEEQFLSLAGTYRNCAGGPTPWNSWISCEEDTTKKGGKSEVDHGYNFEIPATNRKIVDPVPLKAMGRFNHEAVCVDPSSGIVYQTEDNHDSLIYRFIPKIRGKLTSGGLLQALAVRGSKSFDTRNWTTQKIKLQQSLDVEWITIKVVDTGQDDLRHRGFAQGAALFARGEGMWFGQGEVYFACTNGGRKKSGQVFKYIPSPNEGTVDEKYVPGKLLLFAEPNDTSILKYCDNLTVAPWGDVVLVEDSPESYLRGITSSGKIYNIGKSVGSNSEMAGLCFSPSGKTLFVNIQEQGISIAITGPWGNIRNI